MTPIVCLLIWAAVIVGGLVYSLSKNAEPATICKNCNRVLSGSVYNGRPTYVTCIECAHDPLPVVCAWCQEVIAGTPTAGQPPSHGICKACKLDVYKAEGLEPEEEEINA